MTGLGGDHRIRAPSPPPPSQENQAEWEEGWMGEEGEEFGRLARYPGSCPRPSLWLQAG